jgi:hypothetical protein
VNEAKPNSPIPSSTEHPSQTSEEGESVKEVVERWCCSGCTKESHTHTRARVHDIARLPTYPNLVGTALIPLRPKFWDKLSQGKRKKNKEERRKKKKGRKRKKGATKEIDRDKKEIE